MLAITESTNPYMDRVFRECAERAERIARERDERDGPYFAEMVTGQSPKWHLIQCHPVHEGIAAAHLSARRFGVYVPDLAKEPVAVSGVLRSQRVRMFPGYLLLWCWDVDRHVRRIEACPGVSRIVRHDYPGRVVEVPADLVSRMWFDEEMSILRNDTLQRPEWKPAKRSKRNKKNRKYINAEEPHQITIVPKSYWSNLDGLDDTGRNGALHKALGLP